MPKSSYLALATAVFALGGVFQQAVYNDASAQTQPTFDYTYQQPQQQAAPVGPKPLQPRGFFAYKLSGPFARATQQPAPLPAATQSYAAVPVQTPPPVQAAPMAQPAPAPVYATPIGRPVPAPVYTSPAQVYAAAPPPVVYAVPQPAPPPVYAAPAPIYAAPAPVYSAPPPVYAAPAPVYSSPCGPQGCGVASAAYGYAAAYPQAAFESPYLLDAGDRLRVTVFGQEGLTNSYAVDAAGNVTLPLVGTIPARGQTTERLSYALSERLKQGYIREPKVAIEVEAYRPFFIHGEVTTPGQYAYVANMTVENAIAIAGGFGPRADRNKVTVSRSFNGQTTRAAVGLSYSLRPGDTLRIGERWF